MKLRKYWRTFVRNRNLLIGSIMVLSIILVAILAPVIAPYPYAQAHMADALQPPNAKYWFGTDDFGRDTFSNVIYGTQPALRVALIAMLIELGLGVVLGLIAGYFGGIVDRIVSFAADLTWSMPPIVLSMAVITILGKGLDNVIIAIALVSWAQYTRVVRVKTQAFHAMPFVETAIAFNEKDTRIMFRYIFPNVLPSIIVLASLSIPQTIMSTTALNFLGLGAQPPTPDWGYALSNSFGYITRAPWLAIFPGIALVYTVFGFNLFGEGLRDLLDPRMKV